MSYLNDAFYTPILITGRIMGTPAAGGQRPQSQEFSSGLYQTW